MEYVSILLVNQTFLFITFKMFSNTLIKPVENKLAKEIELAEWSETQLLYRFQEHLVTGQGRSCSN